jgi:hypothetical protein
MKTSSTTVTEVCSIYPLSIRSASLRPESSRRSEVEAIHTQVAQIIRFPSLADRGTLIAPSQAAAFAREHGLTPQRLYWVRNRLGWGAAWRPSAEAPAGLVPVQITEVARAMSEAVIVMRLPADRTSKRFRGQEGHGAIVGSEVSGDGGDGERAARPGADTR